MSLIVHEGSPNWRLEWFGALQADEIRRHAEALPAMHASAWIDLRRVTDCPVSARAAFVDFHRKLMETTERRVWVAASPKLRAIGTWVAHITNDSGIRVVTTEEQAVAWIASSDQRLDPAKRGIQDFLDWQAKQ